MLAKLVSKKFLARGPCDTSDPSSKRGPSVNCNSPYPPHREVVTQSILLLEEKSLFASLIISSMTASGPIETFRVSSRDQLQGLRCTARWKKKTNATSCVSTRQVQLVRSQQMFESLRSHMGLHSEAGSGHSREERLLKIDGLAAARAIRKGSQTFV